MSKKPKFIEFDVVTVIKTGEKRMVDKVIKEDDGFIYVTTPVSDGSVPNDDKKKFYEDELSLTSKKDLKSIKTICSVLSKEEVQFLTDCQVQSLDEIPLSQKSVKWVMEFLTDILFENELEKDNKADDAVLAYLVRIIKKLADSQGLTTYVPNLYYGHVFNNLLANEDSSIDDIVDVIAKLAELGDYSPILSVVPFFAKNKNISPEMIYDLLESAADHDVYKAYCSMALIRLDRKCILYDPDLALSLLSVPNSMGLAPSYYLTSYIIFNYRTEINERLYSFFMCFKAYKEEIGFLLDGIDDVLVPEECFLLGKICKKQNSPSLNRKHALMFFLISKAANEIRKEKPGYLTIGDKGGFKRKIERELSTFTPDEKKYFSTDNVLDPTFGYERLLFADSNEYLIDNIEQDKSEKFLKITMTIQNNVIPAIDSDGIIHLYDKVILRIKGAVPIKNLKTHFYMGLNYTIRFMTQSGMIYFYFNDKGGFGFFDAVGESYQSSLNEWKGPLRPLGKSVKIYDRVLEDESKK